uniref:Fucosyltransferase n=1 Tax=Lotharella globosa TaxID=91324 RepID=A0A7S3ZD39_9EUKA
MSNGQLHIGRGGEVGSLKNRKPLSSKNLLENLGMQSVRMKTVKENDKDRPVMLYLGKCCESHWEMSYVPYCRDGPGCASHPSIAFGDHGDDLYHPMMQCPVKCVVHHDPLMPIDAVLTGGYVSRDDYYNDISRKRRLNQGEEVTQKNRPIAASMCLEPYWRTRPRATNPREMKMVDMLLTTNLNADIWLSRFSLLRLETDSYDWNNGKMWMHWSEYITLPENQPPKWATFDSDYVISVVIGHCDGPNGYPFGYPNRLHYINALSDAGLPVYLTGHLRRCNSGNRNKQRFWASNKRELMRKYKFHLALENCDEKDWVTEKLYQTLMAGIVPVYVGCDNVNQFIPKNAFIRARDFSEPKKLADYLKYLAGNETAYNEYHAWRTNGPSSPEWKHMNWTFDRSTANGFCQVCQNIHAHREKKAQQGETSWGEYWTHAKNKLPAWTLDPQRGWVQEGKPVPIDLEVPAAV